MMLPAPPTMTSRPARQIVSLLACALLLCAQTPGKPAGQAQTPSPLPSQSIVHPDAKRAQKAAERGDKAQTEGRIDEALLAYDEAARYAPQDLTIVGRGAMLRSKLIRQHVDDAERLALAGKLPAAKAELNIAMRIDPSNRTVAERIAQMEQMRDEEPRSRSTEISGMPRLKLQPGKHSFDLRGDTRSAYQQVAQAFGIKATFDPDLVSRNVRLKVQDVDFNTAVSLLGSATATFWRPIYATLMFVAPDSVEKRRQFGLQVEQTFSLPSSVAP